MPKPALLFSYGALSEIRAPNRNSLVYLGLLTARSDTSFPSRTPLLLSRSKAPMTFSLSHCGPVCSLLVALVALAAPVRAQLGSERGFDAHEPAGALPDLDVRYDGGRPADFVREELRTAARGGVGKLRELDRRALAERVPALRLDAHPLFATPHFLRSTVSPLAAAPETGDVEAAKVVAAFLGQHRGLFEIDPRDLDGGRVTRSYNSRRSGVQHWAVLQQVRGLDVYGCELRANVTAAGELISVSSAFLAEPDDGFRISDFRMAPGSALDLALISIGQATRNQQRSVKDDGAWPRFAEWEAEAWERPLTAKRLYFPMTRVELRAAYYVDLGGLGGLNNYAIIIDANTGQTLWRWNGVLHLGGTEDVTFRAFTADSPNPLSPGLPSLGTTVPPIVPRDLVTVTGASVAAFSPLGWINDGGNTTVGNNCSAQSDQTGTNAIDPRPIGTPFRVFDEPMNVGLAPNTYTPASVVNLFYLGNVYHDRIYAAGFDEASGNFQVQNFGNGGVGNDPMALDAQDGGDMDNARYFHAPEGASARIEMYPFVGPTPDHDGALDSDVVYHELAHGTSLRLIGGLTAHQSAGMGEGWGDFIGMSLNSEPGDDPAGNYPLGPYASDQLRGLTSSYYFGIRRFPYTTDLSQNPLTFADIDSLQFSFSPAIPSNPISNLAIPEEIHHVGEVWCSALWECRANLVAKLGFVGNEVMLELVVEGMKLTPDSPNFLEARDAILQAELTLNLGVNLPELWAGFAKRGMGYSATSPNATTVTGVFEAFDVPPGVFFVYPNGRPTQLQPNLETSFAVQVVGPNQLVPGSGFISYDVNGGFSTTVPLIETSLGEYVATLPPTFCFDFVNYELSVDDTSGTFLDPAAAPRYFATVFEGTSGVFVDDFEGNLGWSVSSTAADGQWERGIPLGNGRGDPFADFDGSGTCFLSDNDFLTINSDIDNGSTILTSPVMDLSEDGFVTFAYWLNDTDGGPLSAGDSLSVEVATNPAGTQWSVLRTYTTAAPVWRTDSLRIGRDFPASSTVRFRFTGSDLGTQNTVEVGLDAFSAARLVCSGPGTEYCFGDGSGNICPCGNSVPFGTPTGCINATGRGARIAATGMPSAANDTLHFDLVSAPPGSFSVLISGNNQLFNGLGILSFNGLRCVGGNFKRHGGRAVGANGQSNNGWGGTANPQIGLIAQGQFSVGQTRNFQVVFRESSIAVCQLGLNSSTAFSVVVLP